MGRSGSVIRRAARGAGRGAGPARGGSLVRVAGLGAAGGGRRPRDGRPAARSGGGRERGLVADLFQFRNIGLPLPGYWSTQRNGARFGTDYLSRTAMGKANIFVNTPGETTYFYQDLDEHGERLDGSRAYSVTFPPNGLPPVRGFCSLTLYNEHYFFHPNELRRYSLGTKSKTPAPRRGRVADPDRLRHGTG